MQDDLYDAVRALGARIVAEHVPTETQAYELLAGTFIQAARNGTLLESPKDDSDRFGFGTEMGAGLLCIHILSGMLSLIDSFLSSRRIDRELTAEAQLREAWTRFLVLEGLSPELAKEISLKHASEVLRLLEAKHADSSVEPKQPLPTERT